VPGSTGSNRDHEGLDTQGKQSCSGELDKARTYAGADQTAQGREAPPTELEGSGATTNRSTNRRETAQGGMGTVPLTRALPAAILAKPDAGAIRTRVERDLTDPPVSAAKRSILDLELAFSKHRIGDIPGIAVVPELQKGHELWFIGDMHGDLVGFE